MTLHRLVSRKCNIAGNRARLLRFNKARVLKLQKLLKVLPKAIAFSANIATRWVAPDQNEKVFPQLNCIVFVDFPTRVTDRRTVQILPSLLKDLKTRKERISVGG